MHSSSRTELARGTINRHDQLNIELVTPADAPQAVIVRWPQMPSVLVPTQGDRQPCGRPGTDLRRGADTPRRPQAPLGLRGLPLSATGLTGRSPAALRCAFAATTTRSAGRSHLQDGPTCLGSRAGYARLRWCDGAGEDGGAERVGRYRHLHHHLVVKLARDNEAECVVVCFVGLEVNSPVYLID